MGPFARQAAHDSAQFPDITIQTMWSFAQQAAHEDSLTLAYQNRLPLKGKSIAAYPLLRDAFGQKARGVVFLLDLGKGCRYRVL